jgi:hypothetical protein
MGTIEALARLAREVEKNPASIGVLSTGEACAVALLLNRLDLLEDQFAHPLAAFDCLDLDWQRAIIVLYRTGW